MAATSHRVSAATLAVAALFSFCACTGGSDSTHVFASPVPLAEVLAVPGARSTAVRCEFTVTGEGGQPIAFALLSVEWPEAGRLVFQTDDQGRLTMRLSDELDSEGAVLIAEAKPRGQDLLASSYEESTQPIVGARITLQVSRD
mgnify:CR=1 FL=1